MIEFGAETRRKLAGTITLVAGNPRENEDVIEIRDNNDNFIADVCIRCKWSNNILERAIIVSFHNSKTDEIVELAVLPKICTVWFVYAQVNKILSRLAKFVEERGE